jgi:hypothetical protein
VAYLQTTSVFNFESEKAGGSEYGSGSANLGSNTSCHEEVANSGDLVTPLLDY